MTAIDVQSTRQAVINGTLTPALSAPPTTAQVSYTAVGLDAEYAQYRAGQNLLVLVRALSRRRNEPPALLLAAAAVASLAAADPHVRVKGLSAAAYIETEILPALSRANITGFDLKPFTHELTSLLSIKGH